MPSKGDYPVGYGRPPKHTRFRKGQSGNPSGGRGSFPSFALQLDKALKKRVTVKINGRVRRITRQELIVEQTVNRAASGDWGYVKLLVTQALLDGDGLEQWRYPDGRPKIPFQIMREIMERGDHDDGENGNND